MTSPAFIVVGGGLVGAAIAYGLQRRGVQTLMLDEGDVALRAARGNFGLIWTQSKGVDNPSYAKWTWASAEGWAQLSADLEAETGVPLEYARPGGLEICLSSDEMAVKQAKMERLTTHADHIEYRMLERKALGNLVPGLGLDVVGGCLSAGDGHVNPLLLLRSLHEAFQRLGGRIDSGGKVTAITSASSGFKVDTDGATYEAGQIVIAAGLGTPALAQMVGLDVKVRPQRGQNLVTERIKPFLSMPMSGIRQTGSGAVQLGETQEEVGFDESVTPAGLTKIATRAGRVFPHLKHARVVRAWGALRVMSPDGAPIYAQSKAFPGAYAAVCHSGVTLAAAHANVLAASIVRGKLPSAVKDLGPERFVDA